MREKAAFVLGRIREFELAEQEFSELSDNF
jgi:hypothetical protein